MRTYYALSFSFSSNSFFQQKQKQKQKHGHHWWCLKTPGLKKIESKLKEKIIDNNNNLFL